MTTAAKRLPRESRPAHVRDAGAVFDVQKVRDDFPILRRRVRGRTLVYLDNAATSQKPQVVIDAIRRYYERDNANIHRGVHFLSEHATEEYEGARRTVQAFPQRRRCERDHLCSRRHGSHQPRGADLRPH